MAPSTLLSTTSCPPASWSGRRVTILGLGRHGGGVGAARYLAQRGALVTLSDAADAQALAASLDALADVPIAHIHLGGHDPDDFRTAECVVVNPAIPPEHPALCLARESGAALTSEIEIFLRACRAHVIGVTGSNGKSTTCAMLTAILRAAGRRTWLGGNFGGSLLGEVDHMQAEDWVVLELSSFQLAHLSPQAPLPRLATVTNCTPNHLDWHGSFAHYRSAKERLLAGGAGQGDRVVILNACDIEVARWRQRVLGQTRWSWPLDRLPALRVPGVHNRQNAACAAATAEAAGVAAETIEQTLAEFRGLDHRVQFVAEIAGRHFYNDSKATTPEATIAALEAMHRPVWLLAGGVGKGTSFTLLAERIARQARGAAFFGAAREELLGELAACDAQLPQRGFERLDEALGWCWRQSRAGDAILLSPACASFDQFRDFEHRGREFCRLVGDLAAPAE